MNPYQRIIRGDNIIQEGHIDTQKKFNELLDGEQIKGKSFVDIGCNLGEMCRLLKEAGASYVLGADINYEYIKDARRLNKDIEFLVKDGSDLSGEFDIAICSAMLHYVNNYHEFFKKLARIIKEKVIIDVWLDDEITEKPVFSKSNRGLYIPNREAFLDIVKKFFNKIEEKGRASSPDDSERFIFVLSEPIKTPNVAYLIYGQGGSGKTTLSKSLGIKDILELDSVFIEQKVKKAYYGFSVSDYVDEIFNNKQKEAYLSGHKESVDKWLSYRKNCDVVIEGYDLVYPEYMAMITEALLTNGWDEIKTIKL